ncbi:MAG: CBS domain-containing protein [Roseomonas sp.]|nr:CBS domain-containing protein [Roseomonas sp.]MCA3326400.1 CBS domain-containing protein [Roseomonas sp.]MCA3331533.1 CBS domain-containing protein [Roseomonas sp.]MCA3336424.1 CBS domain-containing protein [Roseomonas sp.]MCA3347856.1 CBS domain-containing protein [Roseomonas sp.]
MLTTAPGHAPIAVLTGPASAAMAAAPPALSAETPLGQAIAAMAAARASAILALDGAGCAIGILTEQDIARRVVFRLGAEVPLAAAMTAPLIACAPDEGLWRAIALLRQHGLRHLPVLDAAGRCLGMLHRAEALAAVSGGLLTHLEALSGDVTAIKAAQAGIARALLAEGLTADAVVRLVNGINLDLHRRILAETIADHGTAPVPFTLLVMGSLGRGESLLTPDQDNGMILEDYPDRDHATVDAWFRSFTEDFNQRLDQAGFPLCPGGIMARNPLWRKTARQWRDQMGIWSNRRVGAALLFGDIVFDFRPAQANEAAAFALRQHLAGLLAARPAWLAAMAAQNASLHVGLTLFGGFADDEPGPGSRTDLKLHGLMPLVAATRLLALRDGMNETGTAQRIAALAARGSITAREASALQAAFSLLLDVLLRQQLADIAAGRRPGNLVDTAAMPKEARQALREALKAVRSFSRTSFAGFTGQVW